MGKKQSGPPPDSSKILSQKLQGMTKKEPSSDQKQIFQQRHEQRMERQKENFEKIPENLLFTKSHKNLLDVTDIQNNLELEDFSDEDEKPILTQSVLNRKQKIILVPVNSER